MFSEQWNHRMKIRLGSPKIVSSFPPLSLCSALELFWGGPRRWPGSEGCPGKKQWEQRAPQIPYYLESFAHKFSIAIFLWGSQVWLEKHSTVFWFISHLDTHPPKLSCWLTTTPSLNLWYLLSIMVNNQAVQEGQTALSCVSACPTLLPLLMLMKEFANNSVLVKVREKSPISLGRNINWRHFANICQF